MNPTGDICELTAAVVALLALMWAVCILWVLGTHYSNLGTDKHDKEMDA